MLTATYYGFVNSSDEDEVVYGTFNWDGKKLFVDGPRKQILQQMLDEPYAVNLIGLAGEKERGMTFLDSKKQPELFITYLHRHYKSAYGRCSRAEESSGKNQQGPANRLPVPEEKPAKTQKDTSSTKVRRNKKHT